MYLVFSLNSDIHEKLLVLLRILEIKGFLSFKMDLENLI